jgi:hypothetical protein
LERVHRNVNFVTVVVVALKPVLKLFSRDRVSVGKSLEEGPGALVQKNNRQTIPRLKVLP